MHGADLYGRGEGVVGQLLLVQEIKYKRCMRGSIFIFHCCNLIYVPKTCIFSLNFTNACYLHCTSSNLRDHLKKRGIILWSLICFASGIIYWWYLNREPLKQNKMIAWVHIPVVHAMTLYFALTTKYTCD